MNQYTVLKERFAMYQRYSLIVSLSAFVVFLIFNTLNTGQQIFELISAIAFYLFVATALESAFLFVLSRIMAIKERNLRK